MTSDLRLRLCVHCKYAENVTDNNFKPLRCLNPEVMAAYSPVNGNTDITCLEERRETPLLTGSGKRPYPCGMGGMLFSERTQQKEND